MRLLLMNLALKHIHSVLVYERCVINVQSGVRMELRLLAQPEPEPRPRNAALTER
jgi:hypothetical protein